MPPLLIAALAVVVSVGWAHRAETPEVGGRSIPVTPVPSAGSLQPGEPFVLALGETVVLQDGLSVRFRLDGPSREDAWPRRDGPIATEP
jgi:hypothetical protein